MDALQTLLLVAAGIFIGCWSLLVGGGVFLTMLLLVGLDHLGVPEARSLATLASLSKLAGLARGLTFGIGAWEQIRPRLRWLVIWSLPMIGAASAGVACAAALETERAGPGITLLALTVGIVGSEARGKGVTRIARSRAARVLLGAYIGFLGAGSGLLLRAGILQAEPDTAWTDAELEAHVLSRVVETFLSAVGLATLVSLGSMNWQLGLPYASGALLSGVLCARLLAWLKSRASDRLKLRLMRLSYLSALCALATS